MARLVNLVREIPGARKYFEGVEEKDYAVLGGMSAEKVLAWTTRSRSSRKLSSKQRVEREPEPAAAAR
jgi:hypothetical protein